MFAGTFDTELELSTVLTADSPASKLLACMKWRIESGVEDIFEKGEEGLQHGEGFLHQMTSGKAYLHGTDRLGRPVFYVHARMHKSSEQSPKALEDFVLFQVSWAGLAHPVNGLQTSLDKSVTVFEYAHCVQGR